MTSSVATRYCLPPVLMTANIFRPRVRSRCSDPFRTGFFQSVCCLFLRAYQALEKARGPKGPRATCLWRGIAGPVKKASLAREPRSFPGGGRSIALALGLGLRVAVGPGARIAFGARLHEAVSDTQLGDENLRRVRMRLDFLAQFADEDTKIVCVVNVDRSPDFLEQMLVGDDVACMLGEHLEQAIFLRRQGQPLVV